MEIKLNGLQSKNDYIDLKIQVYQTDEVRGLKGTMTIFWIPTFTLCILPTKQGPLEVARVHLADPPSSRQATLCFHCASKFSQLNGSHTC